MSQTPYKTEEENRFRALELESSTVLSSQITDLQASTAANASAIVVLQASVVALDALRDSADLNFFVSGSAAGSAIYGVYPAARAITLPTQNALTAYTAVVSETDVSINLKHGGGASALATASIIGTIGWGSAQTAGSVDLAASVDIALGDVLVFQGSTVAASTVADFGWTIQGRSTS
jgi:hypothetical protein